MGATPNSIHDAIVELVCGGDEDKAVDLTYVNDTLWHDFDSVKEYLGLVDWFDDFPELDFNGGISILRGVIEDEDEYDEEDKSRAKELIGVIQDLKEEIKKCREAKEVSARLQELIEKAKDLDDHLAFDFDDLEEFIEKVG